MIGYYGNHYFSEMNAVNYLTPLRSARDPSARFGVQKWGVAGMRRIGGIHRHLFV
jgi:hypothetical protein